jgi:hypothetical protein
MVSLEEARAEAEWAPIVEAPRELSLAAARTLAGRFAGGIELEPPDREAGVCGHCGVEAFVRWSLGQFELCRSCRQRCVKAAARA